MRDSIPAPVTAGEILADELHLLRLFCQIADYEVVGGMGRDGAPTAAVSPNPATPPRNDE